MYFFSSENLAKCNQLQVLCHFPSSKNTERLGSYAVALSMSLCANSSHILGAKTKYKGFTRRMQIYNFESQMVFVGRRNKMTTLSVAGADLRQEIYI